MVRGYQQPKHQQLASITVKGHTLTPRVDMKTGVFSVELEDGEVVGAATLEGLRKDLSERLTKKSTEARTAIGCYIRGVGWSDDDKLLPASYVGKRKGNHNEHSSCYMFQVGASKGETRENLDRRTVGRKILVANVDLDKHAELVEAVKNSRIALETFYKTSSFDPTGECAE